LFSTLNHRVCAGLRRTEGETGDATYQLMDKCNRERRLCLRGNAGYGISPLLVVVQRSLVQFSNSPYLSGQRLIPGIKRHNWQTEI
jgi:hypothetical protein